MPGCVHYHSLRCVMLQLCVLLVVAGDSCVVLRYVAAVLPVVAGDSCVVLCYVAAMCYLWCMAGDSCVVAAMCCL